MKKSTLLFIILLIAFFVFTTVVAVNNHKESDFNGERYVVEEHIVNAGETLWSIGEEAVDDHADVRRWIFEVEKMNDLESSTLDIGQKLLIYVYVG